MTSVRWRDDEGSMPLAMLVVIVGVGLSMVLATTVMRELLNTRSASGRASALLAARTGLSSALAGLRAAKDVGEVGMVSRLPCASGLTAQVTGTVSSAAGSYEATVWYLQDDPDDHDEAWVRAAGVTCATQLGDTPRYAYISTVGTSADGRYQRRLTGTYQFKLRAKGNMPGGHIKVYRTPTAPQDWCLAATMPSRGMPLTMQVCDTDSAGTAVASQKFGYMPDLTLKLMTADPTAYPDGLCAEAGWPQAVGQTIVLHDCIRPTHASQQWSFDQYSNFRGTTDGRTLNEFCWNITQSDRRLMLNDRLGNLNNAPNRRCGLTRTDYQSWNVTADAGSGAAGPQSGQLVNFRQFGKCLDYNSGAGSGASASGLTNSAFPCKQSPSLTDRNWSQVWNQVWNLPTGGTGVIYVVDNTGARRCLRVPGTHARSYATTAQTCPPAGAVTPAELTWRVRGADAATYDEKYRIEGTGAWAGQCLAPLPGMDAAVQADYIGLVPCSGDYLQKWNADPPVSTSGLMTVSEQ